MTVFTTVTAEEWDRIAERRIVDVLASGTITDGVAGRARRITRALAELGPRPDDRHGMTELDVIPADVLRSGRVAPRFWLTNESGEVLTPPWKSPMYYGSSVVRLPITAPYFGYWGWELARAESEGRPPSPVIDFRCNVFALHIETDVM